MFRFYIRNKPVSMTYHCMYHVFADTRFPQKFRSFYAMLLGIFFKVNVMQKSDYTPELLIVTISELSGVPFHNGFHRQSVSDMKRFLIVLSQKVQRFFSRNLLLHFYLLVQNRIITRLALSSKGVFSQTRRSPNNFRDAL